VSLQKIITSLQGKLGNGDRYYTHSYNFLSQEVEKRLGEAINSYKKKASQWGKIHTILGLLAVAFSVASAIFTLSTNQALTVTLSLFSATFAGVITFLNPSNKESNYHNALGECLNYYDEVRFAKFFLEDNNNSEIDKQKRLQDLYDGLKMMNKKLARLI
jgi:hypothetical protein